jgi:hypothetical protein
MGLYGGGGPSVTYQAPVIPKDDSFAKLLEYQTKKEEAADTRAAIERKEAKEEAAAAKAAAEGAANAKRFAAQAAMPTLRTSLQSQLSSGLISYEDATSQLRAQADKGETDANESIAELTNLYNNQILPGRRATGVGAAYEEILGRQATEEEKSKAMERFSQGYYTSNEELRSSLYKSTEYTDKFNQSYLDNYYDTMFGKQSTDAAGKKTGQRTFKFASNLLPQMAEGTTARTGVVTPQFGDFTGTAAEIEDQQQNVRDTRQYLYSAGLTNLQGEIDKETQKLKTEGSKELAKIQSQGSIYNSLVGSFNF